MRLGISHTLVYPVQAPVNFTIKRECVCITITSNVIHSILIKGQHLMLHH